MTRKLSHDELKHDLCVQIEIAQLPCFVLVVKQIVNHDPTEDELMRKFLEMKGGDIYREERSTVQSPLNRFSAGKHFQHDPTEEEALIYLLLWRNGFIIH